MATGFDYIQPPANTGVGKQIRATTLVETVGPATGNNVLEQVVIIGDPAVAAAQVSIPQLVATAISASTYILPVQGSHTLYNGSTYDAAKSAPGAVGIPSINSEGTKTSYSVGGQISPTTNATDIAILNGSGSKTIRVTRVEVGIEASGAGNGDIQLVKRSAANTSGTSSTPAPVPHDSADSNATAILQQYSTNPTPGASVGTIRAAKIGITAANGMNNFIWDFTTRNTKGIVLRTTSQGLALNMNGSTISNTTAVSYSYEWTEE